MERRRDSVSSLRRAFDPGLLRSEGHRLVDLLADHLARSISRGDELPVLPAARPAQALAAWPGEFPEEPGYERLDELFARVIAGSNHLHHPHYVGHQVTAPLPVAALADFMAALLNNSMAVFEMGPVSTAMERRVLRFFAESLGMDERADGVLTSGGSIGNLTALLEPMLMVFLGVVIGGVVIAMYMPIFKLVTVVGK